MNTALASAQGKPGPVAAMLRSSLVRSVDLIGPAGRLEALVNEGASDAPFAALVCHPHPLGGGTMHNKVVYHAMKVLNDPEWGLSWPVLRFNFRGTERSQGTHNGEAETEDVRAALDWLEDEYKRPLVVVGFSFGAAMALTACCGHTKHKTSVRALAALGLPLHHGEQKYSYPFLADCTLPKIFISGDQDQFASASQLVQTAASAAEPKQTVLIPGADHFFTGHLAPMQLSLARWLKEQLQ